ncbi:MAG: hypothetical protein IJD49_04355 [Clostridia bacterium]|nr:hypothetical protein [Clostridia bacterium]
MSKVKIRFEVVLKTEDEDEVIGIKEAMAYFVEEWKDIEKPIKIEIIDPQKEQSEIEAMFEEFWKEYPRKVNKVNSFKAFKKVCKDRKMLDSLLMALAQHKRTEQWKTASLIPHASTWLNGHRWEDDLTTLADKLEGQKASYNLDKFEQKSLTDEVVYKRREKKENVS